MSKDILTIEKLEEALTPVARKYGWKAQEVQEGLFKVIITDGQHEAAGEVDSLDDIEVIVRDLEKEIDGQDYATIG